MWDQVTKIHILSWVCIEQVQRLRLVITDKIFIQHCKAYLHHRYQHLASNSCFTMQHYISNLISHKANKIQNLEVKGPTSVEDSHPPNYRSISVEGNGFFSPQKFCKSTYTRDATTRGRWERQNWLKGWLARHRFNHD